MADMISPERRSAIMARIRSQDTLPELLVRRFLHKRGLRFRIHQRQLPGKPDYRLSFAQNLRVCPWLLLAWLSEVC
jgi:DNA mismatch endonuclease Vsr